MAFEKLKSQQQRMPMPQARAPSAPPLSIPKAKPGAAEQLGSAVKGQALNKVADSVVTKGTELLFPASAKAATGAAAAGAGASTGALGSGLMAAAMTNPVTAPLAIGAAALGGKKMMGK